MNESINESSASRIAHPLLNKFSNSAKNCQVFYFFFSFFNILKASLKLKFQANITENPN